ncbi:MAG: NAD-dependent epimerase/dehydratase family protein [Anaerolineae bacterium]|nr:NAD-dependent epimerase/dehydratase family protein [Anaerolineae bacterium]
MQVLVVGGTGLISTGITRQLVERGDEVTLYNRGQRQADMGEQIVRKVRQIHGDRNDAPTFEAQMAQAGSFDAVIDMICFHPEQATSTIRAFRGRTAQVVFCSTVDVYTKPAKSYPIREDAERRPSPTFPYAFDKAKCERLFEAAHARGDFAVTTIRPAWTYGEGGSILHSFGWNTFLLDRLRKGKPVIVHGDGTSFWAACHRDDVARAFVGALGNKKAYGKGYHVTGEQWLTWDAYHCLIADLLGAPAPKLVHIPTDLLGQVAPQAAEWCVENFHFNNIFDNTAACTDLGFRYTIPFAEGARRAIDWLEGHGGFEDCVDHPFYDRIIAAWQRLSDRAAEELADLA